MLETVEFGKRSGFTIPRVNIGAMRLPENIDEAVELLRYAIDNGMKYIDTSRGYGDSEEKLAKALKDGYREKVILSTKWAPWIRKIEDSDDASADCVLKRIEESMKRLDVSVLDFYAVWNIQNVDAYNKAVAPGGFVDGIKKARDMGLVKHIGATAHLEAKEMVPRLQEMDWCEVLLVSHNIFNRSWSPIIDKAHELGIGTITMNPVGGGKFAEDSPVFEPLKTSVGADTLAELAIRYVLSNTKINTLISGISKKSDVDSVLAAAKKPLFSDTQKKEIEDFIDNLSSEKVSFCTSCGYCLPCPQDINIPKVMESIYYKRFLGLNEHAATFYKNIPNAGWIKGTNAAVCTQCGSCKPKCTQHLDIPAEMKLAEELWG